MHCRVWNDSTKLPFSLSEWPWTWQLLGTCKHRQLCFIRAYPVCSVATVPIMSKNTVLTFWVKLNCCAFLFPLLKHMDDGTFLGILSVCLSVKRWSAFMDYKISHISVQRMKLCWINSVYGSPFSLLSRLSYLVRFTYKDGSFCYILCWSA